MRTTTALPRSAGLAVWFTAWAAGATSLDDARDAVVADDTAHDVLGLPGETGPQPLILALGRLRAAGATSAGLALPVPGDPLGLGGPAAFNTDALDAEEAVVLDGLDGGLVPHVVGAGVTWRFHDAVSRRQLPDVSEADTRLRQVLVEVANTLARLGVARWRPEVADELVSLRRGPDLTFPPGWHPRAARMASLAVRCRAIVDLARDDDGGAVSAAEAEARRAALTALDQAARRALVAACSHGAGR